MNVVLFIFPCTVHTFQAPIYRYSFTDLAEMVSQQPDANATSSSTTTTFGNRRRRRGTSSESNRKSESEAESSADAGRGLFSPLARGRSTMESSATKEKNANRTAETPDADDGVVWPASPTVGKIEFSTSNNVRRYDSGDAESTEVSPEGGLMLRSIVRKPSAATSRYTPGNRDNNFTNVDNALDRRRASSADRSLNVPVRKGVAFTLPTMSDGKKHANNESDPTTMAAGDLKKE